MSASLSRTLAALLLTGCLMCGSSTIADEAPWAIHNADGIAASADGDWQAAEAAFRAALDALAAEEPDAAPNAVWTGEDDARVAMVAGNLAVVLLERGETAEARALFEQALEIRRTLFGTRHSAIAESLNNLAELERRTGNPERARQLHEAALDVRREVFEAGHPDIAESLNNLGVLLRDQGELEASAAALGEAYALRRERLGAGHELTLDSAANLATVALDKGDLVTAEAVLRAILDAEPEDGLPAYLLRSAVDVFLLQGAVDDAVLLCEAHVVEQDVAFADALAGAELMSACARALGRVDSEVRAMTLLEGHLNDLSDPSPAVEAELRWGLAEAATLSGDLAAAESSLDIVVELLTEADDPRLPTALNNRGSIKFERGRPLEAASDLEATLSIIDDPHTPAEPELLRDVLANYAIVLRALDRDDAALGVENRLIEIVTEKNELEIAPAAGQ